MSHHGVSDWGFDLSGTFVNRPADPDIGIFYVTSDTNRIFHYDGAAWQETARIGSDPTFGTTTIELGLITSVICNTLFCTNDLTLSSGGDIVTKTTGAGTKIGAATDQLIGFWGATPAVQPAGAAQADQGDPTFSQGNIDTGTDMTAAEASALVADIAALDVLLTEIRTVLVNVGIMKGAA